MTCCAEKKGRFFFLGGGEGGLVVCSWGELRWGRRRRNRGGEAERGYINFCRRIHRGHYSVCDSVG